MGGNELIIITAYNLYTQVCILSILNDNFKNIMCSLLQLYSHLDSAYSPSDRKRLSFGLVLDFNEAFDTMRHST